MMRAIFALAMLCVSTFAHADSTINNLSPCAGLSGSESIPAVQTVNPACRTSPNAIRAFVGQPGGPPSGAAGGDLTGNYPNPTLPTVNANVGSFGSATQCTAFTTNAKGLITAASAVTCTPAIASISGFGTGVATALGLGAGTAGGVVLFNGAGGTPSAITLTNGTGLPATSLTGTLQAAQEPAHTGDVTNSAGSLALTLATVNANVGSFGSATQCTAFTTNAKGLITAASAVTCTPAIASLTGLGTGVATALGINVGSAGAFVVNGGALGTPSSGVGTNLTALNASNLGSGTVPAARTNGHQNGTATNDSAAAGEIGEYVSSTVLIGSAVSLTTATAANVTSISLTAGDWDVWGNVTFNPAGTTTLTALIGWISTTSATLPTIPNAGAYISLQLPYPTGTPQTIPVGMTRVSVSGTTTVYLSGYSIFATSTMGAYGFIGARRVR